MLLRNICRRLFRKRLIKLHPQDVHIKATRQSQLIAFIGLCTINVLSTRVYIKTLSKFAQQWYFNGSPGKTFPRLLILSFFKLRFVALFANGVNIVTMYRSRNGYSGNPIPYFSCMLCEFIVQYLYRCRAALERYLIFRGTYTNRAENATGPTLARQRFLRRFVTRSHPPVPPPLPPPYHRYHLTAFYGSRNRGRGTTFVLQKEKLRRGNYYVLGGTTRSYHIILWIIAFKTPYFSSAPPGNVKSQTDRPCYNPAATVATYWLE